MVIFQKSVMTKTKTTILLDERLLEQFRTLTTAKHASSRMLRSEFEEAIRAFSPLEIIRSLADKLRLKIDQYPSLDKVARTRPRVRLSAGKVVREMRDERQEASQNCQN